ncbi:hypothetical protein [uncultured Albimonas sp.]|uniref:hypothetical protein n=1 Tax=uncultured Albimonas sp. TaxID=1331701 RepID=UPI0030EB3268|tara:strand:- start:11545 stop:12303 length:759 start_codon:yes stop_codon:yes gene_type:complete
MSDDPETIDWYAMPTAERIAAIRSLYRVFRQVADLSGRHAEDLMDDALGSPRARSASDMNNFSKGRIARTRVRAIHTWLIGNHFETGQQLAPQLFQSNPETDWELFLKRHASAEGKLEVVPLKSERGLTERAGNQAENVQTLRLGQSFCLRLTSPIKGVAVAFECYQRKWYPIPLGADQRKVRTSIGVGQQWLPKEANGDPIALVEHNDAGVHRYVVVMSEDAALPADRQSLVRASLANTPATFDVEMNFVT